MASGMWLRKKRCSGTKADGTPCESVFTNRSGRCPAHDGKCGRFGSGWDSAHPVKPGWTPSPTMKEAQRVSRIERKAMRELSRRGR